MKIHLLSDLHLEFSNYQPHLCAESADVIVLAGDIWSKDHGIHWARATWPDHEIVYVAGNHEHYGADIHVNLARMRVAAQETGVHFLENDEVVIQGVRFLGCTLWTDFEVFGQEQRKNAMIDGERCLNDFRLIRNGEWNFNAQDSIDLHLESVHWLEMKLKKEPFAGNTVVVTHHAPSWSSVVPRFAKSLLSACFASRLDYLMGFSSLWLHGHMHDSLDYREAGTRVICNPRGYARYEMPCENSYFQAGLLIDVEDSGQAITEE